MVRRFRIPPPLRQRRAGEKEIVVDLESSLPEMVRESVEKSGLRPLYVSVCKEWLPYVRKKLEGVPPSALDEELAGIADGTTRGLAESLCRLMALTYLGRRVGNFTLMVEEERPDGTRMESCDATVEATSSALTELAAIVGERTATEIFRNLQKAVERVLKARISQRHER